MSVLPRNGRAMNIDLEMAEHCRRRVEELRVIAADKIVRQNRQVLLRLAIDYDRMAERYEANPETPKKRKSAFSLKTG
jgi:hypothetical protein